MSRETNTRLTCHSTASTELWVLAHLIQKGPQDVICQVHHYTHIEIILRKAWEKGDIKFDGAAIKILPNISRAALQHGLCSDLCWKWLDRQELHTAGAFPSRQHSRGSKDHSLYKHQQTLLPYLASWGSILSRCLTGFNLYRECWAELPLPASGGILRPDGRGVGAAPA